MAQVARFEDARRFLRVLEPPRGEDELFRVLRVLEVDAHAAVAQNWLETDHGGWYLSVYGKKLYL